MRVPNAGRNPRKPDEAPDVFARKPAHRASSYNGLDERLGVSFRLVPVRLAERRGWYSGHGDTFVPNINGILIR